MRTSGNSALTRSFVVVGQDLILPEFNEARRSAGSRSRAQSIMTTTPVGSPRASTVRSAARSM
jgi:hypothetical protein